MNRKQLILTALLSVGIVAFAPQILQATKGKPIKALCDTWMPQGENNYLPNKKMMKTIIHRAQTRGHASHGWLDSHHTFSFANYYNPERMHFGVLRVLNDDVVQAGMGFGTHPHDNMEIISIPLEGDLEHKDSMGNVAIIKEGDVQVMSAGTGITHSEYNPNRNKEVKFLQIWVLPKVKNVTPRYDQISLKDIEKENQFYQILSPNNNDQGVWIHQDAWFHMGEFLNDTTLTYSLKKPDNGLYIMQIEGVSEIEGNTLNRRDALEVENANEITINMKANSSILVMEVPMK